MMERLRAAARAAAALALAFAPGMTLAAPGLGEKVYGATVTAGETEFEARYGALAGGADDGEDALTLEVEHGVSSRLAIGVLAEFEKEPGQRRRLEEVAVEAIVPLGRIEALQLDTALYAEYGAVRGGHDVLETKLLLQHRRGPFDARLNLAAEKRLGTHDPMELGYAASAGWEAFGEVSLGVEAFGEMGSTRNFLPRAEHFLGPFAKVEVEHLPGGSEVEIEAGYLFALAAARDDTKGQFRLMLEWATRF